MSADYYKAIEKLKPYLNIPRAEQSVRRAIEILNEEAIQAANDDMLAQQILLELHQHSYNSDFEVYKNIICAFLINEGFIETNPDQFTLKGFNETYLYELIIVEACGIVTLKRLATAKRRAKAGTHVYEDMPLPLLTEESKELDKKRIERIIRELKADYRKTWEYIQIDRTPSTSNTNTEQLSVFEVREEDFV